MMNDFTMSSNTRVARRSVQVPLADRTVTTELSGDFSLPDYQPEIKRLLRIGVGLLPPSCTEGPGVMTGALDYYVLYMGHDNALWCAPLSTDYRLEMPAEDTRGLMAEAGEPIICLSDVSTETPIGRVTAPRRLSIRCRLHAHVKMYGECLSYEEPTEGESHDIDASDTEILRGSREVSRLYRGVSEAIPLQDDIILPPSESGEWRVVCAEGRVMVTEASAAEGAVLCRGDVCVKLTLCPAEALDAEAFFADMDEFSSSSASQTAKDSSLTILQRKIPFSQSVRVDGVSHLCTATACGYATDLSVEMEEGHVHMELGVILEARAQGNETVTYTKDIYSTRREGEARQAVYPTEYAVRALNGNFTLSESLPLSEVGLEADAHVVDVTAVASAESLVCDPDKGRCVLTGKCRAHLLLARDGEYTQSAIETPFRYEFDIPATAAGEEIGFDGQVNVFNCHARTDHERVALDAELAVSLRAHHTSPMTALADVSFGEPVTRRRGEYLICFPAPSDTLWSVAKRYHAPVAALTAANNLPVGPADAPESLEGIGYLIV